MLDVIEDFMRTQAQTQDMTITQQLDAGLRFFDIRMMLEYTDTPAEWFSLHFMQSVGTSMDYFTEVRQWMDAHPTEIVVMWLSKHGNDCATGEDQYPNVSVEQKQAHWQNILKLFDGITVDHSITHINETSINNMIKNNQRAVFYVSDYVEMTGYNSEYSLSTPYYALDGCDVDNHLMGSDFPTMVNTQRSMYAEANGVKAEDKTQRKLYLVSLAGASPQVGYSMYPKLYIFNHAI